MNALSPQDTQRKLEAGTPLIDVRTANEFESVHARGARNVPLDTLDPEELAQTLSLSKDGSLLVISQSSSRSRLAQQRLTEAGWSDVIIVEGGTNSWVSLGLPVECASRRNGRGFARQMFFSGGVLAAALLLMPCSPWSFWGNAWCPIRQQTHSQIQGEQAPAARLDFSRDVVLASKMAPVLVDFNATWCGPCLKQGPELDRIADERAGKLTLVKIDVDQNQDVASVQGVEGIPDVRLWKDGREVARFTGYRSHGDVSAWLDAAIATGPQ